METHARQGIQLWLQELLENEVSQFLASMHKTRNIWERSIWWGDAREYPM